MEFFKTKGGGQFFKKTGEKVIIVCLYTFNPGVEVTTYDPKLVAALDAQPSDKAEFTGAYSQALEILQGALLAA